MSVEKLKEIEVTLKDPVKLSEAEIEKFNTIFKAIKEWVDDAQESCMDMDRDEAYRYTRLLVQKLKRTDIDFIAGVKPHEKIPTKPTEPGVPGVSQQHKEDPERFPIHRVNRPTKEMFQEWLDNLAPHARKIAEGLDCVSQFLDPDSDVSIEIVCNDCSPERMERCIKDADPSIEDSISIFMKHQTE